MRWWFRYAIYISFNIRVLLVFKRGIFWRELLYFLLVWMHIRLKKVSVYNYYEMIDKIIHLLNRNFIGD